MYVFGPVPSRRLGKSLGVDLVPHKTCTLDCIYCECGRTTLQTTQRKSYVSLNCVLGEIDRVLKDKPDLDYITFSGSGEPTLSSDIGEVIHYLKKFHPEYKVALLTNGTLLSDRNLRKDLLQLDLIVPSIDAVSEGVFQKINQPHGVLKVIDVIEGITEFKNEFKGQMWIEVFILPNVNDDIDEINRLKDVCLSIGPDKIQLNTLDRPAPHNTILTPVSHEKLVQIKEILFPLQVEIVGGVNTDKSLNGFKNLSESTLENIIEFLRRRPATVEDLVDSLGLKNVEVNKMLRKLEESNSLVFKDEARGRFFYLKKE